MQICLAIVPIVLIRWQLSVLWIKKCSFYIIPEERSGKQFARNERCMSV